VVRVKVLGVDAARKRISLTLRLDDEPGGQPRPPREARPAREAPAQPNRGRGGGPARGAPGGAPTGSMADALRRAGLSGDRRSKP
jgi:uncharacterized protein